MTLAYVGALPLPLLCPQLQLCIGLPSIQFSADLSGALALNASLTISPPTAALYLSALIETELLLGLTIAPIPLPAVNFTASVSANLEVSFSLSLSLLLNFELGLSLSGFLTASIGAYAFTYEGTGSGLGATLTTELASTWPGGAPTSGACNAIILGAVTPGAQASLAQFLDGLTFGPGLVVQATLSAVADMTPLCAKAEAQAEAAISAKLSAQAAITASLGAQVSIALPTVTLEALGKFQASLVADLALAPPAIGVAVSATASLAANIQASAGFMAQLGAAMSWSKFFCYTYSGTGAGLGAAVTTALASTWGDGTTPTSSDCACVVLATTDAFSASVLAAFFGGL